MRSLAFAVAISAMALVPSGNAGAFPIAPDAGASVESNVLQVRDGCGPGMRFSNRMGGCVRDFDDGYRRGPPPGYYPPPPPPRYAPPGCPPGMRWSNGRRMCVYF
jgi:hypothetical protein